MDKPERALNAHQRLSYWEANSFWVINSYQRKMSYTVIGQTKPFSNSRTIFENSTMESDPGFLAAVEEAKAGFEEGGVPIGACLVSKDGTILGKGHNMRVQKGSATLHVGFTDWHTSEHVLYPSYCSPLSQPFLGRDLRSREYRQASSHRLPRCNHVHHTVTM